ncbi:hypothetical protein [Streptomyces sp. V4I8]|uniref:3'-5' exonuclease n=1 Tax=Streptomyces sp. V4I8 TaxID=3156469 RepID=UPI003516DF0C
MSTGQDGGAALLWRVLAAREEQASLDDAVRALRRPASWPREREQAAGWARRLLADTTLTALDVETAGLANAFAVQIAAVTRDGTVVFSEYVQPDAVIEPDAIAVHGITPQRWREPRPSGSCCPASPGRQGVAAPPTAQAGGAQRQARRPPRCPALINCPAAGARSLRRGQW